MPTGVGKTETMLSALVSKRCEKVLVIVPTDALRTQLADKFLTLGILGERASAILDSGALTPVVCTLRHVLPDGDQAYAILRDSQVIVTTSSLISQTPAEVQRIFADQCTHLFIDEAHHAEAPTWRAFKALFADRHILQFTATPFREDGKPIDGRLIYAYPLRKAQADGYFQPIRFEAVEEFDPSRADVAIAERAVMQLREEVDLGHIMMARVSSVERAKEVFKLYEPHGEFNPVQLHTGITSKRERERIRKQIIAGESRIVVCVDMLGEGFDLPELKIAAFHDIRKTLSVTLQLAGRFTRARPGLGNATFIANTADIEVQEELRALYSRDPDWNVLLPTLADHLVGEQIARQTFLEGFPDDHGEIPLGAVRPAMSAVVYRTQCDAWTPENARAGIPHVHQCTDVFEAVNERDRTVVVVTKRPLEVNWSPSEGFVDWEWEMVVAHWSEAQDLLFINGSANSGTYGAFAKALAGEDVELIRGATVFKIFGQITRLRLQNVGLTEQLGRNLRYTGRMGSYVDPVITDTQRRHTTKSVLAGVGYESGASVSVGASRKGRIWTHRRGRLDEFVTWCQQTGQKLLDDTIDPEDVLRGTLRVSPVDDRPAKVPFYAGWPECFIVERESNWSFLVDGEEFRLSEVDIQVRDRAENGPVRLAIVAPDREIPFEQRFVRVDEKVSIEFRFGGGEEVLIRHGAGGRLYAADEFLRVNPLTIWFADGSSIEGSDYVEIDGAQPPYDREKLLVWDWQGVDIRTESQGLEKRRDTVQGRVIERLLEGDYEVLFDDDGPGEVADVVAVRRAIERELESLVIELYHCKFSLNEEPGARIKDLYEVCGQAQKSISWNASPERHRDMFTHLMRRETSRRGRGEPSRLEVGEFETLRTLREMSRFRPVRLKIFIVQPGLSKVNASDHQLELLGVTENHLMETYQLPLRIICGA